MTEKRQRSIAKRLKRKPARELKKERRRRSANKLIRATRHCCIDGSELDDVMLAITLSKFKPGKLAKKSI